MPFTIFVLLVIITPLLLGLFVVSALYRKGRKETSFKVFMTLITCIALLITAELFFYTKSKTGVFENPALPTMGSLQASEHSGLLYEHKPHINWKGQSQGDLAFRNLDADPYSYEVLYKTDKDGFRNHTEISSADVIFIGVCIT